jgi:hypothetical protein
VGGLLDAPDGFLLVAHLDPTYWRTGTAGRTRSAICAAVSHASLAS